MNYIKIGVIVNTHGIRGEVKIKHFSDSADRFETLGHVFVGEGSVKERLDIEGIRYVKATVLLKFEGLDDLNAVEPMKGKDVFIEKAQLRDLPEGTYHVFELLGLEVFEKGARVGEVVDVDQNAYQDLYVVRTKTGKTVRIPAVKAFVKGIDLKNRRMEVELIEGMLE